MCLGAQIRPKGSELRAQSTDIKLPSVEGLGVGFLKVVNILTHIQPVNYRLAFFFLLKTNKN